MDKKSKSIPPSELDKIWENVPFETIKYLPNGKIETVRYESTKYGWKPISC